MDQTLLHEGQYDPVKAHIYYLQNRKLKGRKPGSGAQPTGRNPDGSRATTKKTGKSVAFVNNALVSAAVNDRTKQLHKRLDALNILLKQLLKQAHESNVKKTATKTGKATAAADTKAKDRKPLTVQEKQKKAADARAVYKRDHPDTNKDQIARVRKQIKEIEAQLRAAVSRARAKAQQTAP